MLEEKLLEKIVGSVDRELKRTAYPTDFPVLPGLPAARYKDAALYDLEIEHVFHKTWVWAAHMSELPEAGSYKLFERFGASVIVSRGQDGEIRAFKNTCRHRGAALLQEPTGKARRFVCPYHAWGYAYDGKLVSVPEERDFGCLDKAELPLLSVRCELWNGFVFINLDDDAAPLAEFMAPLTVRAGDFPFDSLEMKQICTQELDCNWKVAYDNFLEVYHVKVVHAKTVAPMIDSRSFAPSLLPGGHGCFATKKNNASLYEHTMSMAADVLDKEDHVNQYSMALARFPNALSVLDPNGLNWMTFWPVSKDKTMIVCAIMGPRNDDPEQDKAYSDMLVAANMAVIHEDLNLFASIQRSVDSGDLKQMLLSYQEQCIYWYHEQIDRLIGPDKVPAHLRVTPILEDYLER